MGPELPAALRSAIDRELEGVGRQDLAARAAATSAAYRAGGTSAAAIRTDRDALAYALARLPATYAAVAAVLTELSRRAPDFSPRRLLDAGSGPGGGSWAALQAWPAIDEVCWLDANPAFLDLARRLAQGAPGLRSAEPRRGDLRSAEVPKADLVLASYVLAELAEPAGAALRLWAACDGVLALVEPGTPAGFQRILQAREALVGAGAAILAPCAHAADCPLTAPDWCHFSVRLPRSRDHLIAKGARVPFEDERFSYLLAARPQVGGSAARARVLAPPEAAKPGTHLKLCTAGGLERRFVPRRDKPAHAAVRRIGWGSEAP